MAAAGNREKQLTNTIAVLRNEMERRDITHQRNMEAITRTHHNEAAQLRRCEHMKKIRRPASGTACSS